MGAKACGSSESAIKQRVKVGAKCSSWQVKWKEATQHLPAVFKGFSNGAKVHLEHKILNAISGKRNYVIFEPKNQYEI